MLHPGRKNRFLVDAVGVTENQDGGANAQSQSLVSALDVI